MNTQQLRTGLGCALALFTAAASAQTYMAIPIGTLGGTYSNVGGVNANAVVVGTSETLEGLQHAFVWENGVLTDLGTLTGGDLSGANSINDSGVIVGWSKNSDNVDRPVKWEKVDGQWQISDLGTLGGAFGRANRISNSGLIAGFSYPPTGPYHTTVWTGTTTLEYSPINPPNRNPFNLALGINNAGDVVGIEYTPLLGFGDIGVHYLADGTPTNLTPEGNFVTAHPHNVNSAGLVGGYLTGPRITAGKDRAGIYNFEEGWQLIPTLPGHDSAQGYDINESSEVVGTSFSSDFEGLAPVAFLYSGGTVIDLNAASFGAPFRITEAYDVSDNGLIGANMQGEFGAIAVLLMPMAAPPCPADFNQDGGVDGADVASFFVAWEASDNSADVNQDGGIDGGDVATFFVAWEAGGC